MSSSTGNIVHNKNVQFEFEEIRENMSMAEKEKEVQRRYQQEQTRYKMQVEKINKIEKKKVA